MAPRPLLFVLFLLSLPLPGLLLLARTGLHRSLRAPGARAAAAALLSCGITSLVGLGSALAGAFSLGLVTAANGGLAALLLVVGGRPRWHGLGRLRAPGAGSLRPALAAALAAAAAALLYAQPYEQFFGGWDPGVYVNTGANLARTGSLAIRDAELPSVPEEDREVFLYRRRGLSGKYPGFIVRDADRGLVQPYFNHLFPVWIALFVSGLGPRGGLYVAPLFALLSAGMLAVVGGAIFSRRAGAAAALLFGFSIPAVWSARFQTAEPVALFFSLGGWLGAALFARGGRRAWAVVAAAAFGCALLAKITAFLPVVLLLGAVCVQAIAARDRRRALLAAALGAALLAVAPYALTACREYTATVFRAVLLRRGLLAAALPLLALGAAGAAWAAGIFLRRHGAAVRGGAAVLLALLFLFGAFVRPSVDRSTDAANLPQLAWFVTPLALALALAGMLLCLLRPARGRRGEAQLLLLAVTAAAAAFLLHRKQITPIYLWALRRYVPELLPALALFAGAAVARLRGTGPGRGARAAAAGLLIAAVCGLGLWRGRHLIAHREYAGALERIGQVAAHIPEGSLTVCVEGWLAAPLQHLFGRPTLAAYDLTPEKGERLARFLRDRVPEGRPLYFAAVGGDFLSREIGLDLVARVDFDLPELERTRASYPRKIGRFAHEVFLFRVVPSPGSWDPGRIAVAKAPFGLRGEVHQPERSGAGGAASSFRWIGSRATLDLPRPPQGRDWELGLRLGSGRPQGAPPPQVRLLVADRPLAAFPVPRPGMESYRFTVPAALAPGARELTLIADTFVPAESGLSKDRRSLGVMLEEVSVR